MGEQFAQPLRPGDPFFNLQVAWEAFNENYAFFEQRGINWREQQERARIRLKPNMTAETSEGEILEVRRDNF